MTFTGNFAKALGKRLRLGDFSSADTQDLEEFIAFYDPILSGLHIAVDRALSEFGVAYALAGRLKRGKSIIRKLRQPKNKGMDLSRMVDIAGLRLLVRTLEEQDRICNLISDTLEFVEIKDTRESLTYRSVHLIVSESETFRMAEIQVRTLPQQLWANESECFGEEVKNGRGDDYVQDYLGLLATDCKALDVSSSTADRHLCHPLGVARLPVQLSYKRLVDNFAAVSAHRANNPEARSHIVVFDNQVQAPLQDLVYSPAERGKALTDYVQLIKDTDESRIETLMLNASTGRTLRATHPRFFPE